MPRLIQKSGYIKNGKVSGYMEYVATRDGVEIIQSTEPVTKKPKENSFSLHRIRLPRLHLPHVSIPALISLLMAAAALLLLWWGLGTVWSSFSLLPL